MGDVILTPLYIYSVPSFNTEKYYYFINIKHFQTNVL